MNALLGHIGVLLVALRRGRGRTRVRRRASSSTGRSFSVPPASTPRFSFAGAVLATVAMERALITHDFSVAYVAANSSRQTPLLYTITGMWSALAGSILLWGLILSGYIGAVAVRFRRSASDPLVGWAMLVLFSVAAFFFASDGRTVGPVQDHHRHHPDRRARPERAACRTTRSLPSTRRFFTWGSSVSRSRSRSPSLLSRQDGCARRGRR